MHFRSRVLGMKWERKEHKGKTSKSWFTALIHDTWSSPKIGGRNWNYGRSLWWQRQDTYYLTIWPMTAVWELEIEVALDVKHGVLTFMLKVCYYISFECVFWFYFQYSPTCYSSIILFFELYLIFNWKILPLQV